MTEEIRVFNIRLAIRESTTANLEYERTAYVVSERIDRIIYQSTLALQYLDKTLDNMMKQLDDALHERLSLSLISPQRLRESFNMISSRIPWTLSLHDFAGNVILWYYKKLKVMVISEADKV